ncbi:sphingosine N-acyltransferase lac1 [Phakopsora pachyrhizi]|uniref:Sphingosine N-acyltransferase lac1 n=1 Tax=Phakopsora pachyrhizi TaxID=170000 RepID=A0AAV0B140_PHAPC|nr:sphingosine N-acyltransferase lac1 [Phakopsora pachyrhizi]
MRSRRRTAKKHNFLSSLTSTPKRKWIVADCYLAAALFSISMIVILNLYHPTLSKSHKLLLSTYQTRIPTVQFDHPISKLLYLSYLNPVSGKFFKGNDDIYFIGFWVLFWMCLREILMNYLWKPVGKAFKIRDKNKLQRFAEQGWMLAYCSVFWCMGLSILSRFPDPILSLNIRQYWQGYPHESLPALTKFYYLSQTAFWFQQLITLHIEKRRKDHYQMLLHHVLTITLICGSYATNFTGLGTAVHSTMDLSDILLSSAKMLNYIEAGIFCDSTFALFVLSWIYTRHYVYMKIVYSILYEAPEDIPFLWDPSQGHLTSRTMWIGFLMLLILLQFILIMWFFMIMKIVLKFAKGKEARDERSDTEDSDEIENNDELPVAENLILCERESIEVSKTDHQWDRKS